MENENSKQTMEIALLKKDIEFIKNSLNEINGNLDRIIRSFNQDKNHIKKYVEDCFVDKKEFSPIKEFYESLQKKIFTGFFTLLTITGIIVLAIFEFIKKK
jgi:5-bromo-4-chloroindolyl phosphate hydrolysis protein